MNSVTVKRRISKFQVGKILWKVLGIVLFCLAFGLTFKAMSSMLSGTARALTRSDAGVIWNESEIVDILNLYAHDLGDDVEAISADEMILLDRGNEVECVFYYPYDIEDRRLTFQNIGYFGGETQYDERLKALSLDEYLVVVAEYEIDFWQSVAEQYPGSIGIVVHSSWIKPCEDVVQRAILMLGCF